MYQVPPLKPFIHFYQSGRLRAKFDPEEEELRGYHNNGQLWGVYPCKNRVPHGLAKGYREDGSLEWETTWKNGCVDGPARRFYPSGELYIAEIFSNGNKVVFAAFDKEGGVLMSLSEN